MFIIAENEVLNFGVFEGYSGAENVQHSSAPFSSLMRKEDLSGELASYDHFGEEAPAHTQHQLQTAGHQRALFQASLASRVSCQAGHM
jgi:hypothetical protein